MNIDGFIIRYTSSVTNSELKFAPRLIYYPRDTSKKQRKDYRLIFGEKIDSLARLIKKSKVPIKIVGLLTLHQTAFNSNACKLEYYEKLPSPQEKY